MKIKNMFELPPPSHLSFRNMPFLGRPSVFVPHKNPQRLRRNFFVGSRTLQVRGFLHVHVASACYPGPVGVTKTSGKLTWLAGISPFSMGNTSSIRLHLPASYVSLPECTPLKFNMEQTQRSLPAISEIPALKTIMN